MDACTNEYLFGIDFFQVPNIILLTHANPKFKDFINDTCRIGLLTLSIKSCQELFLSCWKTWRIIFSLAGMQSAFSSWLRSLELPMGPVSPTHMWYLEHIMTVSSLCSRWCTCSGLRCSGGTSQCSILFSIAWTCFSGRGSRSSSTPTTSPLRRPCPATSEGCPRTRTTLRGGSFHDPLPLSPF